MSRSASASRKKPHISLAELPTWAEDSAAQEQQASDARLEAAFAGHPYRGPPRQFNAAANSAISIVRKDITKLKVDAIVNAAAVSLGSGGGGIDGAIRSAAGPGLSAELKGKKCSRGCVVPSKGHNLPAKHVLHTVAPHGSTEGGDDILLSCCTGCLACMEQLGLRTVAFCCLGTGIFKFPAVRSAQITLGAVRDWLDEKGPGAVDRVVFCTYTSDDYQIYLKLAPYYFPLEASGSGGPEASTSAGPEASGSAGPEASGSAGPEASSSAGLEAAGSAGLEAVGSAGLEGGSAEPGEGPTPT